MRRAGTQAGKRSFLLLLAALLMVPGGVAGGIGTAAAADSGSDAAQVTDGTPDLAGAVLSLSAPAGKVGSELTVTVKGDRLADVYAYELELDYDASKLEYVSAFYESQGLGVPASGPAGTLKLAHTLVGAETAGIDGSAALLTVTFRAKAAGTAALSLKNVKLVDSALHSAAPASASGVNVVIAAADSGGNTSGTDSAGSINPAGQSAGTKTLTVTAAQAAAAVSGGTASLAVPAGTGAVRLPAETLAALDGQTLALDGGSFTLKLPAALMQTLGQRAAAANAALVIQAEPVTAADAAAQLERGASGRIMTGVTSAGEAYTFSLSLEKAGSAAEHIAAFDEPLTLTLRAAAGADRDVTGIYYIAADGSLEYIGADWNGDEVSAPVGHFSTYAVLSVERGFADVPVSHWAHGAVRALAAKGIAAGNGTAFEPGRDVTRAEFAAMLTRLLGLRAGSAGSAFTDVKAGTWYADAVAAAAGAGLVTGRSAVTFDPAGTLTRQEMAVMLLRAYTYQHGGAAGSPAASAAAFADLAQAAPWAADAVRSVSALGLVQGRSAGRFAPAATLTRAEAAQALYGLLK